MSFTHLGKTFVFALLTSFIKISFQGNRPSLKVLHIHLDNSNILRIETKYGCTLWGHTGRRSTVAKKQQVLLHWLGRLKTIRLNARNAANNGNGLQALSAINSRNTRSIYIYFSFVNVLYKITDKSRILSSRELYKDMKKLCRISICWKYWQSNEWPRSSKVHVRQRKGCLGATKVVTQL